LIGTLIGSTVLVVYSF